LCFAPQQLCFAPRVFPQNTIYILTVPTQYPDRLRHYSCLMPIPLRIISIGSDKTLFFRSLSTSSDKNGWKYFNSYLRIISSNWNRKLVPNVYSQVQIFSQPVRSMFIILCGTQPLLSCFLIDDRHNLYMSPYKLQDRSVFSPRIS
jgi:hypothetical protein